MRQRMRSEKCIAVALGLGLSSACSIAGAVEYIRPGDTWKYVATAPGIIHPNTNGFESLDYDDSAWLTGNAPFGNYYGDANFIPRTYWEAGYDPFIRKTITLAAPVDMVAEIGVDNGYALYVNGNLISANNAEGYTYRWEYTVPIPRRFFVTGNNLIALALEDHGGLTAFDMRLTGPQAPTVPEPGGATLFGFGGLMLLAFWSRKRSRG